MGDSYYPWTSIKNLLSQSITFFAPEIDNSTEEGSGEAVGWEFSIRLLALLLFLNHRDQSTHIYIIVSGK